MSDGWWPYLLVGVGGFIGANARFLVARLAATWTESGFPLGTLVINVSGSFLLGVVGTIAAQRLVPNADAVRLALGVGFLGAYTTFSTFTFETNALVDQGAWFAAALNVGVSVVVGLVSVRAGIVVATLWSAP